MRLWRSPFGLGAHAHPSRRPSVLAAPGVASSTRQREHGHRHLTAGVIMRRRSRHTSTNGEPPEWPATTVDDAVDAATQPDAPVDHALRALARLLARQAAREVFERECGQDVNPEDLP